MYTMGASFQGIRPSPNLVGLSALVRTNSVTNSYPMTHVASQPVSMMHWRSRADDRGSRDLSTKVPGTMSPFLAAKSTTAHGAVWGRPVHPH